jgi:hypothetical protein
MPYERRDEMAFSQIVDLVILVVKIILVYLFVFNSVFASLGIITLIVSMIYPWVALGICGLVILYSINPVASMNRVVRQLG